MRILHKAPADCQDANVNTVILRFFIKETQKHTSTFLYRISINGKNYYSCCLYFIKIDYSIFSFSRHPFHFKKYHKIIWLFYNNFRLYCYILFAFYGHCAIKNLIPNYKLFRLFQDFQFAQFLFLFFYFLPG